jgi:2-phosphosulfolactate phosphatase
MYFDQQNYDIHCEWGSEGLSTLAPGSDAVVIIDVLSFTTCVDVALSRGCKVYPFAWKDERSREFADSMGAILATGSRRDSSAFSLAPSSLLRLPEGASVVLPSPNGARLSLAVGEVPAFAACLRNAQVVAQAAQRVGRRVSLIPAGERWPDGSLRPALEDWLAAGAVIACLPGSRSPEAAASEAVFRHFAPDLLTVLLACGSGREAGERGSRRDVELAAELNASPVAPRLVGGAYQSWTNL